MMRACGVAGWRANWIWYSISERKQRVAVNGRMSSWKEVSSGTYLGDHYWNHYYS